MKSLNDVEIKFRNQIEVPENKSNKQFLFCPVGFVGAGKTTVTKPISKIFNLVRLSSDELREILKEGGYDYSPGKEIGFRIAREFIQKGYSLAFDMNCSSPITKKFVEDISKEFSIPVVWVHINPPEEFVMNKLKIFKPEYSWLFKSPEESIANHMRQKEMLADTIKEINFDYVFDTSKTDLEPQMSELSSIIQSKVF
ncbi:MAG TPA: hypothetical protein VGC58_01175 [Candidatus Paceibacterota bacterium]